MKLCRVCNVEDFADPQLIDLLRVVYPHEFDRPGYPAGNEHRKAWEIAHAYHLITKADIITDTPLPRILGVGAGRESTIFLLTEWGEVHATDLYAEAGMWHQAAPMDMLRNPASCAPAGIEWHPYFLIVQHMDGRHLQYPGHHFDAVFSSSSIEHFGTLDDIAQAAREIGRVLKPGGVASISTEYKISGPGGIGWDGVVVFDEANLRKYIIEPSGLELIEPLDLTVTEATLASNYPLIDAVNDYQQGREPRRPHIVMSHDGYIFSSVHLALRKPW